MTRAWSQGSIALLIAMLAGAVNAQPGQAISAGWSTSSQHNVQPAVAQEPASETVTLASWSPPNLSEAVVDDCEACGTEPGWLVASSPMVGRGGQFFLGGEYLAVRALPSEAVSYLTRDVVDITNPSDTFHEFDFDYDASFRVYGGYRLACCGEEIRFTYTRFDSSASFVSPDVVGGTGELTYISPLEVVAVTDGARVQGTADVELSNYDLGWSKTIPLGGPLGCDPCGGCEDPCNDCCGSPCPAWDITFTGALRAADLSGHRSYISYDGSDVAQTTGDSYLDFDGVGARVGLQGRRYLGRGGIASLYMKGDISLLVGDYETRQARASAATPSQVTRQSISGTHIVPVTEIEVGGTVFLTCRTSLSAGYFLAAWHDLGFRDEYDFGLQTSYDDANIMGFDGYFVRLEHTF